MKSRLAAGSLAAALVLWACGEPQQPTVPLEVAPVPAGLADAYVIPLAAIGRPGEPEPAASASLTPTGPVSAAAPVASDDADDLVTFSGGTLSYEPLRTYANINFEGLNDQATLSVLSIAGAQFPGWLATKDVDDGGTGLIANEPSGTTAAVWVCAGGGTNCSTSDNQREIVFAKPVSQVIFQYSSVVPVTIQAFDPAGVLLATQVKQPNVSLSSLPPGDPTGIFGRWSAFDVNVGENRIKRLRLSGSPNRVVIDSYEHIRINHPPVAEAGGPYTVVEGTPLQLQGSATDEDGDPITLRWDFGDGSNGVGATPLHSYAADEGSYVAVLTAIDRPNDAEHSDAADIVVVNAIPAVVPGGDITLAAGVTGFSRSGSFTDPGTDSWTATVDYGDGSGEKALALQGKTFQLSHSYSKGGSYRVTVTVTDDDEGEGSADFLVTVANRPPSVTSISPLTGVEGSPLTLTAAASDPDGGALTYQWSIGTSSGSGNPVSATFPQDGSYPVSVTVSDGAGGTTTRAGTVVVADVAPAVTLAAIPGAVEDADFSISGAFTDPGALDGPWSYTIDWGDGSSSVGSAAAPGAIVGTHAYDAPDGYTVTLTVKDRKGVEGTATREVEVSSANQAPTLSVGGPYAGVEGSPVALAWSGADADGDALTYTWDFGDGHTGTGLALPAQHGYAQNGTFTLSATATDGKGPAVARTGKVVITNAPPVVQLTPSATTLAAGGTISLAVAATDAGVNDGPWSYSIDWDDGRPAQTGTLTSLPASITRTHSYSTVGNHTISVSVTDRDGGAGTKSVSVTVRDEEAPSLTVSASPGSLWPPNHKYHRIRLDLDAADDQTAAGEIRLTATVVSSEPDDAPGGGDGKTTGDIQVTRPYAPKSSRVLHSSPSSPVVEFDPRRDILELRAERSGSAAGRVYTITVTATDAAGNATTTITRVAVDHDKGR